MAPVAAAELENARLSRFTQTKRNPGRHTEVRCAGGYVVTLDRNLGRSNETLQ